MHRKRTKKELREFDEFIREGNKPEFVCDANVKCPGWEKHVRNNLNNAIALKIIKSDNWKYCPWCGKKIK